MNKRIFSVVLACTLFVNASLALASGNPNARPGGTTPQYAVNLLQDVEIVMRDGVVTRANIHVPEGEGPWPTILVTTPYSNTYTYLPVEQFAACGYVVVYRDARGFFTSDGLAQLPYGKEIYDQYDTMDWIVAQPWSNGKIGALGASQLGQTALYAAISGHPNLVCAAPMVTSENVWRDGWYFRNGAFESYFLTYWASTIHGRNLAHKFIEGEALELFLDEVAMFMVDRTPYLEDLPVVDFPAGAVSEDFNMFKQWASHPALDEYWLLNSPATYISAINVPVMHIGGWYDIFGNGTIQSFINAKNNALTRFARDNQYLVMGPWGHAGDLGPVDLDRDDYAMAFMDYWLKDLQRPYFDPNMHAVYYTLQTDSGDWTPTRAADYPLPQVQDTAYYLNPGQSGTIESLNDGSLSTAISPAGTTPQTYVYDPMDPTPTRGGNLHSTQYAYGPDGSPHGGPVEQTPVDRRSLTFTSAPLASDLEILGRVTAVLYAATDAVDTDWIVRLNDVAPDGTSTLVVDGITRARFHSSIMNPNPIEPGRIYEYEVDLWSNSWIFKEGHRLRVTVNSSSFPRWSRNLNVADFPEQATDWKVANNTIYLDPERPSRVILPIIPK